MVEAPTTSSGSQMLSIAPVNKASALGLFREAELVTHIDVVLQSYIAEAERVAQVSNCLRIIWLKLMEVILV